MTKRQKKEIRLPTRPVHYYRVKGWIETYEDDQLSDYAEQVETTVQSTSAAGAREAALEQWIDASPKRYARAAAWKGDDTDVEVEDLGEVPLDVLLRRAGAPELPLVWPEEHAT